MAQVATIESTELPPNPQFQTPEQEQGQDRDLEQPTIESQNEDDNKESPTTTTATATTNTERCTGEFVYTRAAILQLFKPYPLPKGFVQLNHITSKEPLAPLALAPTQEHPDDTGQSKFSSAKHRQHRGRGRGDVLRSSWSPGLDYLKSSIGGTNPSNRFSDVNRDVYGNLASSLRTEDSNGGGGVSALSSSVDQLFAQQDEDEEWEYKDNFGHIQGPFSSSQMNDWYREGYFPKDIPIRSSFDKEFLPLSVRLLGSPNPFDNNRRSQPSQQPQSPHPYFNLSRSLEQEYDGRNVISSLSNSIDSNDIPASGQDEASNQNSIVNLLLRASLRASQEHQPVSSTSSESSPATTTSVTQESPSSTPSAPSDAPQPAPSSDVQESAGNTNVPQGNWLEQLFEKAEIARSNSSPSSAPATGHSWAPVKEGVWNVDQVEALSGGNPGELNLSSNWLVNSISENGTFYQPPSQPQSNLPQFQPPPQNFVWSSLSCSTEELFPSPTPAFNSWEMFPGSYPPEQHENYGHNNNNNNNNMHFNPRREHHGQPHSRSDRGQSHRGGRGGRGGGFRGRGGRGGGGSRGYYQKHY